MNRIELKKLFLETVKQSNGIPREIILDGVKHTYNGEQIMGNCTIFRYRPSNQLNHENIKTERMITIETVLIDNAISVGV